MKKEKDLYSIEIKSIFKQRTCLSLRKNPSIQRTRAKNSPTSPIENIDLNRNALTGKKNII